MIRQKSDSFIVFSTSKTSDGATVRISPEFSSDYGIKSVAGALNSEHVRISPDSAGTWWNISCDFKAEGAFSFAATLTENPPAEGEESVTLTCTIHVLVFGQDRPMLSRNFYQFAVGEAVEVDGIKGICAQQFFDVGIDETGQLQSWDGATRYDSGLNVVAVQDDYSGKTVAAKLIGTAARPGLYAFRVTTNSVTPQHETNPFPPGSATDTVFVAIYDPCAAGTLMVLDTAAAYHFNPDAFRVVTHSVSHFSAERLVGAFTRSGEAFEWTRDDSKKSTNYTQFWNYRVTRTGDAWNLQGRTYFTGDTVPEWTQYATVAALAGSDYPPSAGWSAGVVVMGAARYFVAGHGFFDRKSDTLYQSSPGYVRRFDGWNFTAGVPGGVLMTLEDGAWKIAGAVVEPVAIAGAALPYSPPRAGDVALENVNFNKFPQSLAFAGGGAGAGFWKHYPVHRWISPVNPRPSASVKISASYSYTSKRREDGQWWNSQRPSSYYKHDTVVDDNYSVSKSVVSPVPLKAETVDDGALSMFYGIIDNPTTEHTETRALFESDMTAEMSSSYGWTRDTQKNITCGASTGRATAAIAVGSGRNPGNSVEMAFAAADAAVSAGWPVTETTTVVLTTKFVDGRPDETTTTTTTGETTGGYGDGTASVCPKAFAPGGSLPVSGVTVTRTEQSFYLKYSASRYHAIYYPDVYPEPVEDLNVAGEFSATHSRVTYQYTGGSAELRPATGTTTTTTNGATASYDDPDGSIYADFVDSCAADLPDNPPGGKPSGTSPGAGEELYNSGQNYKLEESTTTIRTVTLGSN